MQTKLTIGERMKDLRVEKGLTLEALGQQTGLSRSALAIMRAATSKTSVPLPSRPWRSFTACLPTICWA